MSFSLFLRGFLVAIAIFAVVTYALTQSVATTLINTLICAVLIQAGYAVAVLWLVAREKPEGKRSAQDARAEVPSSDPSSPTKPGRIGGLPDSRRL
ncbi:exopolysaccharide production repressor protein exox [Aliihoeflea aestuarii]|jgi:exopolysaccharide production repressor protein|nr:exopolysaccharide production repressor protein exox [Aliihoeflea aestuarii]